MTVELESPEKYLYYDDCSYEDDLALEEKYSFKSMTTIEVKQKVITENINEGKAFSQFMAQAITNAFFQTSKDPGLGDFLIPSFLVTNSKVFICMYCVNHDILLMRSPPLQLWDSEVRIFNMETIFELWLTLNFDRFGGPVTGELLRLVDKLNLRSGFQQILEGMENGSIFTFREKIKSPIAEGSGIVWGDLKKMALAEED